MDSKIFARKSEPLGVKVNNYNDFRKALAFVLPWEGGYVNDPDDPGGETKWGISKRAHPTEDIELLTPERAAQIYADDYWTPLGCDGIKFPFNVAIVIAALYKFVTLDDRHGLRECLHAECLRLQLKGTLLLAHEGINGTVAGSRAGINALLSLLRADPRLADLEHKESLTETYPFERMKVRVKREIVSLGAPEADPTQRVRIYRACRLECADRGP